HHCNQHNRRQESCSNSISLCCFLKRQRSEPSIATHSSTRVTLTSTSILCSRRRRNSIDQGSLNDFQRAHGLSQAPQYIKSTLCPLESTDCSFFKTGA